MAAVFGRERELSLGDHFLDSAAKEMSVLLLEGEAGIGKTTVWREVVRRAEERGIRVLSCRPTEAETKLGLSAVCDLLEGVGDESLTALPGPQQRALAVVLLPVDVGEAEARPHTLASAVRSLLAELSGDTPLLVAIDDLQWLDATSATVLGFALRRLTGQRVGWLVARRLSEPLRLDPNRLVAPDSLMRSRIGPLTLAALHHVLEGRLEQPLSRPALVRVHRASGGNPFYALEVARELLRIGYAAGTPVPVPDDLRDLLSKRLRRLPAETREALLVAAALSDPTIYLVDDRALAPAEAAELVHVDASGRIAFRHPLYASAVYGTAPQARRRDVHRRLADKVSDPEEKAHHLAVAAVVADERVANALEDGATLARQRGAWDSAAELLEQASRLTPPGKARRREHTRRVAAAEHWVHAGDRAHARALLEEILAEPLPRPLRARALCLLAEISYNDENVGEARRLFMEALEHADRELAVRAEIGLAYVSAYDIQDHVHGREFAYQALEHAATSGTEAQIATALGLCTMFDFLSGRAVDWEKVERAARQADRDSDLPLNVQPATIRALLLLYVDRLSEARERLHEVHAAATDRGDESDVAFVLLWLSWLETRAGRFDAAHELEAEGAALARLTGSETTSAWAVAQRAYIEAHRGNIAETRRLCADVAVLVAETGNALLAIWVGASLALLELSLANPRAAADACAELVRAVEHHGVVELTHMFFLPDTLEALIALGELDRAGAVLDAFEARARELDRVWALATGGRCRGLLLAAQGDLNGAAAALKQALAEHERLEMPFERARTLLVNGVLERRRRKRALAKESFEQALEIFERRGGRLWAERAREELRRLGLHRSDDDRLTEGERRVAELAAQGLTNRAVAAALYISPKTVEANLARVYRKLGVTSRAELGARMSMSDRTRETPDVTPAAPS